MEDWSTEGLPQRERFAFWHDAVCDAFLRVRTEHARHASFYGRIGSSALGGLRINDVTSGGHLVRRDRHALSQGPDAAFFVNLHKTGSCALSQSGRQQIADAGEVTFHDGTRPFDLHFHSDYSLTCFIVPRDLLLAHAADAADKVAMPLAHGGATALFRSYAESLAAAERSLSPCERERAALILVELLALALAGNCQGGLINRRSTRDALFHTVCAQIRRYLADPALDLAVISKRAAVAPRTLQRVFHEHGTTCTSYLLEQRLLLAQQQLATKSGQSVSEIAYAVGFSDLSYFSRAFRQRFGMSPSERRLGSERPA